MGLHLGYQRNVHADSVNNKVRILILSSVVITTEGIQLNSEFLNALTENESELVYFRCKLSLSFPKTQI